jgi:Protein of unknown function (DUF3563)
MLQCTTWHIDAFTKERKMKLIWDFLRRLAEPLERRERDREQAYLAQSTDMYDLESRMREIDRAKQLRGHWMGGTGS